MSTQEQRDGRRPYTDKPNDDYSDNVASFSPYYNKSKEWRRAQGEKFGPNWASILHGIGDQ